MSDIRVFVTFPTTSSGSAIFAGDTLQCKITFKNMSAVPMAQPVAPPLQPPVQSMPLHVQSQLPPPQINGRAKKPTSITGVDKARGAAMSPRIPQSAQGHRPSLSLSAPANKGMQAKISPNASPILENGTALGHKHKRSISIVSMNSELGDFSEVGRGHQKGASIGGLGWQGPPLTRDNIRRGHGRSASLQVSPRPRGVGSSPSNSQSVAFPNSPIINTPQLPPSITPKLVDSGDSMGKFSFFKRGNVTPGPTPILTQGLWSPVSFISKEKRMHSDNLNMAFKFPTQLPESPLVPPHSQPNPGDIAGDVAMKITNIDLRSPLDGSSDSESLPNGTSPHKPAVGLGINSESIRTSGEFYSLTNSTTETLVSEYDSRLPRNGLMWSQYGRAQSSVAGGGPRPAEVLMMGYAQVIGTFILDGTLVQTSQFDEIKRRGVVGSQGGGGVVGVEQKTDGKFLGSFGWGSLGGAIGGLLGGNSMSSIAEMKSQASQRSIPILSTPQSILFVNLKLAVGESRTYEFRFPLPKGLPPSHRGMAIKVNYMLKIGTQRAGKAVQQPKVIEIPFRVFPHVDINGAFRSHDLLQPIILLRDEGKVISVDENPAPAQYPQHPAEKLMPRQESSLRDFFLYVDSLMPQQSGVHLDSPSSIRRPLPTPVRTYSVTEESSSLENIETAILHGRGGGSIPPSARSCIYEIARNGHKVASLTLPRPAYILGDTITAIIDFSGAVIPCYHVGYLSSLPCLGNC